MTAKYVYVSAMPAFEMNRFWPFRTHESPSRTARERIAAASDPDSGSVKQYASCRSPRTTPPISSFFWSSFPASITGIDPSRFTTGISDTPADTLQISSMKTQNSSSPPDPPNSSG